MDMPGAMELLSSLRPDAIDLSSEIHTAALIPRLRMGQHDGGPATSTVRGGHGRRETDLATATVVMTTTPMAPSQILPLVATPTSDR